MKTHLEHWTDTRIKQLVNFVTTVLHVNHTSQTYLPTNDVIRFDYIKISSTKLKNKIKIPHFLLSHHQFIKNYVKSNVM